MKIKSEVGEIVVAVIGILMTSQINHHKKQKASWPAFAAVFFGLYSEIPEINT